MCLLRATDVCVSGRTYTGADVHMPFGMYAVHTTLEKYLSIFILSFSPCFAKPEYDDACTPVTHALCLGWSVPVWIQVIMIVEFKTKINSFIHPSLPWWQE